MNLMTDAWTTFGRDQGQMVERSYRYDYERGRIVRRVHDRSFGSYVYASAADDIDVDEWNGSESHVPFDESALTWRDEDRDPFGD